MTDDNVVATSDDGRFRVILEQDTDCAKPMDDDDGWVTSVLTFDGMSTWQTHTTWQAMRDPESRLDALTHFDDHVGDFNRAEPEEKFKRWMRLYHGIEVHDVTIVNGYRHTSNGLAWVEQSELTRVGFVVLAPTDPGAKAIIDKEIAEHNHWAEGDCWGYRVQELTNWLSEDETRSMQTWEDTGDSVWGFIGREYAEQEATEALAGHGEES